MGAVNVQGRIDMKSLATVTMAYLDRGSSFASRSDLMWRIVEDAAIAAEAVGAKRPETDEAALHYLEAVGINLTGSDRGRREVRRALIGDTGVHDFYGEDLFGRRTTKGQSKQRGKVEDLFWRTDVELYNEVADNMKRMGLVPISFEEYIENKAKKEAEAAAQAAEEIDQVAYAEKEAKRLAEEKAAYSPEALQAALAATQ